VIVGAAMAMSPGTADRVSAKWMAAAIIVFAVPIAASGYMVRDELRGGSR
jgi:hypothetical protein